MGHLHIFSGEMFIQILRPFFQWGYLSFRHGVVRAGCRPCVRRVVCRSWRSRRGLTLYFLGGISTDVCDVDDAWPLSFLRGRI